MHAQNDAAKVNAVNVLAVVTAYELANVQLILSIAVLAVSFAYTCYKFHNEYKDRKKRNETL